MLRWSHATLHRKVSTVLKGQLNPFEALTQMQLGITPPLALQRGFLLEHCEQHLERLGITEGKLLAMDGRLCTQLTKKIVYELYLAVPFRVFTFDMEFTGPPVFTADGPTEDITELGLYSPLLDETFSCLVQPVCGRKQGPGVEKLTQITDAMLKNEGIPFLEAWQRFLAFVQAPQPGEISGSEKRILLLSHGGKLADVSLIKGTLEKFKMELPSSFVFGDTIHIIRDAHRRRPVTVDKHPPSWKLGDLLQWLHIPLTLPAHRAGNDARMTWDALYHTLLRYGDDEMTPREQLVPRFFDEEAKQRLREYAVRRSSERDSLSLDGTFLLADASRCVSSEHAESSGVGESADLSASCGTSKSAKGGAATDLLDLDFDDIFSAQKKSGANASIVEFKLDDEGDALHSSPTEAQDSAACREPPSDPTGSPAAFSTDAGAQNDSVSVSNVNEAATSAPGPTLGAKTAPSRRREAKASASSPRTRASRKDTRRGSATDKGVVKASDPPAAALDGGATVFMV
ncbi:hypothetical protein JKF63_04645 [Porcisia hertigi]|uniref:Exonuclease domain-containing protein n=1 Tax=Porcisia hertigi TaxID=2761500 RepID=A0A836IFC5_9TRYP|nr:hypothetical protein JKF63_04645 [Porcisia hertigi]